MESQPLHQGADQIEVLPACNWISVLLIRSYLTCITEDQKVNLGPVFAAVQNEELL